MENLRETLPPGLVDAAASIPGFGSIAQFVLSKFGFDIGNVVSLYLLLFAIYQGASFVYTRGRGYFMCVRYLSRTISLMITDSHS